ncbi:hypothetical protein PoB_005521600 [Plakobranchus ocellatus]|uniref:Uncharacterized protein n=1 Tax=Plakobranchus ocellatus TaxID=259542 RepID=A0AAV4CBI8_9GAST|nr:hypothetical protein PoB_005521600 [Plakobranchus ocellatus]
MSLGLNSKRWKHSLNIYRKQLPCPAIEHSVTLSAQPSAHVDRSVAINSKLLSGRTDFWTKIELGKGTGDGARTRDRRVPADLRTDSLSTVPLTYHSKTANTRKMYLKQQQCSNNNKIHNSSNNTIKQQQ